MKKIQTGETIYLKNIGDIRNLKINEYFFNFTRDISTPTYELVSLKYIFRAYECDDPYKEGTKEYDYRIIEEVSEKEFFDTFDNRFICFSEDHELDYCCEKVIIATFKNIDTNEIFEDIQKRHHSYGLYDNIYTSDFIDWSSKDENEAFELADWYFKKIY